MTTPQLKNPTIPDTNGGSPGVGAAPKNSCIDSIAPKPLLSETKDATKELVSLGSDSIQRTDEPSFSSIPRFDTPINEYLDQTPCSADSSRKLPVESPAIFSKIESGVSLPENRLVTSGITRNFSESLLASASEIMRWLQWLNLSKYV